MLLDRSLDCVTPMCTQLTYEGLVDETLRIRNGAVTLDGPAGAIHRLKCWCQAKSRGRLHCSQRSVQSDAGSKECSVLDCAEKVRVPGSCPVYVWTWCFNLALPGAGAKQRIVLNSADKVFRELRDLSFAAVGPRLGERAKAIQADYKDSKARQSSPLHQSLSI